MRSPLRWTQRQIELTRISPRRRELETELAEFCGHRVKLVPASAKGGYDEIYNAMHKRKRFAVVRVNSPFKRQDDPIGPNDPGVPLDSAERLEREWSAYERLSTSGMSPNPIWRTDDAIACSWVDLERASRILTQTPDLFWTLIERIVPAIGQMHNSGVTHLDLNLGNILTDRDGNRVVFIDFEFGPVPWVDLAQQMAFDYLRLIDDCTKRRRGGNHLLGDVARLVDILNGCVDDRARAADMRFSLDKLKRLADLPELCQQLRQIFRGL
jgi:hypothetical protein